MNNINFKKIFYLLILQTIFIHFNCKLNSETQTQAMNQTPSKTLTQTLYQTKIPPFGNIEFTGTVDLIKKEFTLKGAPTQEKFDISILQIQNPFAAISNTKGLTIQATVSLFNQTGTLAIEEFIPKGANKRTLFSITPKNPITLSIPCKKTPLKLTKFSLLVTPKKREVTATVSLFGKQDTLISFGKEKTIDAQPTSNNYAKIFFKELNASKFSSKASKVDFVNLKNIIIKIENPFKKGVKHPTTMSGIVNIKLPGKLGDISTEFTSEYKEGKFEIFVKTQKAINIANGKIKLENTGVKFSTDGELTISGDAKILGMDITGYLTFKKLTAEERTQSNFVKIGNYKVEFLGKRKDDQPIKPFAQFTKLPEKIKNIEIKNPTIGLKANKQFYLSGDIKILGFESTAEITVRAKNQASLKIKPPKEWVEKNLLKKVGTQLDLSDTHIIISSHQYIDEKLNQTINKGFNVISGVTIVANSNLSTLLGKIKGELFLIGSFGTSLTDMSLAVSIPINIKLSDNVSLQNINLVISGMGEMGIKSQIKLENPKLLFTGEFAIDPKTASVIVKGTMEGIWESPLGIKGISISNTAVEFGIATTPPVPVPTKIGIAGMLNIGSVQGEAAVKIDVTGQGGIIAKLNKLTLKDLLTIPAKLTPGINWNKLQKAVPDILIKNVDIKAALIPFDIGELHFEPGIKLKGEIKILDKFKAMIDCNVGSNGIIAKGTASKITIGKILTITGAGFDGIYGNEDDGPTVDFELTVQKQKFMISGMGKLMGIEGQTDVSIGRSGIKFRTMYDILGSGMILEGTSIGNIKDIDSLDFKVHGQFKDELTKHIVDKIREKLGSVAGAIAKFYGTLVMPLKIAKVQIWTSFKELIKGKLPRARIDVHVFGKELTIDEQLDLKKPHKMVWHLTKSILNGMQQFITGLPAEIAKKFCQAKDAVFNTAKEIVNIIKRGNVVLHNDTKYKIKIISHYSLIGTKKTYGEIKIPANSSESKMLQKDLRDMKLYIEKDGKWEKVNSWPGNSNIVDTYDYKTVHINFAHFPDETKQQFRRRIKEGNTVIKDWFSKKETKQKETISSKKELTKKYFKKYLKREATIKEIDRYLRWYPQKYSGIIDSTQTEKIKKTDEKIEKNIMRHPDRKRRLINEYFKKYYNRKPNKQEFNTLFRGFWNRDEIIEHRIKASAPQNRKKTIAGWIEQYTNRAAEPEEIDHYFNNWDKFKGLSQVGGRIRESQAAINARQEAINKWFEKYHNRKPTPDELKKYGGTGEFAYKLWEYKGFKGAEKTIKELSAP